MRRKSAEIITNENSPDETLLVNEESPEEAFLVQTAHGLLQDNEIDYALGYEAGMEDLDNDADDEVERKGEYTTSAENSDSSIYSVNNSTDQWATVEDSSSDPSDKDKTPPQPPPYWRGDSPRPSNLSPVAGPMPVS